MGLMDKMGERMMGKMDPEERKAMMDKMMGNFFGNMTPEDKQGMMSEMMEKFMGSMTAEEKKGMMQNMIPKMMAGMMGGGGSGMMNMMSMMMGGKKTEAKEKSEVSGEMPWDMCKKMMAHMSKTSELATFATPEVRGLFEEWATQIEEEILRFLQDEKTDDLESLSAHFKLSAASITYFLTRLANKGKINLKAKKADNR